ncbi:MAG: DASH family cryptochrome [Taibaiella sp.]|nr:DASH family cryptochrome [Taibaiella sp.]
MNTSIVWFKTDLRLSDNETLFRAIEQSDIVLPVYCFEDEQYEICEFGFGRTGNFRAQFLLASLQDLDAQLRVLGSGLVILVGNAVEEIAKLALQVGAKRVYAKEEIAAYEKSTQLKLESKLSAIDCMLQTYSTGSLYEVADLPFSIRHIPEVFTAFRTKVEKEACIRPIFEKPKQIRSPAIKPLELPDLKQLGLSDPGIDTRRPIYFEGGAAAAHKRLHYYFSETQAISTYKETRNGLVGADYSTKFSPWLANGCLSPREIYWELKKYEEMHGANESTYWLVFELLWRDYFRCIMQKHGIKFFLQTGLKRGVANNCNQHNKDALTRWINGETGVDFIDANMLELKNTGFMSNRGRQNVASFLINDLQIDWRYGAAYFEQQLIDYDVFSNWGNWAYLAGVGNDPRGNRYFNAQKQANNYDADGVYRNLWLNK